MEVLGEKEFSESYGQFKSCFSLEILEKKDVEICETLSQSKRRKSFSPKKHVEVGKGGSFLKLDKSIASEPRNWPLNQENVKKIIY